MQLTGLIGRASWGAACRGSAYVLTSRPWLMALVVVALVDGLIGLQHAWKLAAR